MTCYDGAMMTPLADELALIVARLRLTGVETTTVEVKSAVGKLPKSMPETLSAFANGSGGVVVLGLDERIGFLPAKGFHAAPIRDALAGVCADRMQPPLRLDIQVVGFESAQLVVARIDPLPPMHRPCFIKERGMYAGSFIRTGDGDRKLSQYEIERLVDEHGQPRWDEEIVEDAAITDLDAALLEPLVARQRTLRPNLFSSGTSEIILQGLRVVKPDAAGVLRPTLAGLLAVGAYPQHFFPRLNVTFASFPGESKAEVIGDGERLLDSVSFVGPIPAMIRDATSAVVRNARMAGRMDGVFRREIPEYPLVAVREAITNALMHRDYSPLARGTQVQVNLFIDRLEVLSPGGLFGTVTLAKLGSPGLSSARNQRLSTLLEEVPHPDGGMVAENRGSGYLLMQSALAKQHRPALIAEDDISFFSLTFPGRTLSSTTPAEPAILSVAEAVARSGLISAAQVAEETGLSRSAVSNQLRTLIAQGLVMQTRPTRSKLQQYRWIGDRADEA